MTEDKPINPREMDSDDFARLGIGRVSRGSAIRARLLTIWRFADRRGRPRAGGH